MSQVSVSATETNRAKLYAARLSVAATGALAIGKVVVGWLIGSIGVLSEGLHSFTDLAAALIAYFAVRRSSKPPDADHPYGHGKYESISGAVEALLILVAAAGIIYAAIMKLIRGAHVSEPGWGIVTMAVDVAANFWVSLVLFKVAKQTESIALEADGWHLRTHVYTSLGVVFGLALVMLTGFHAFDPIAAIAVALLIAKAGFHILHDAWLHLVDAALPTQEKEVIVKLLNKHQKRFVNFHALRTRRSGPYRYIDLHLVVTKGTPIEEAHALCDELEEEIKAILQRAEVTIHLEPEGARAP